MNVNRRNSLLSAGLVAGLACVLVVLAALQYRWTSRLSLDERERMQASLSASAEEFRQGFYREIVSVAGAFQIDPFTSGGPAWESDYVQRLSSWERTEPHPGLVEQVYVFKRSAGRPSALLLLDRKTGRFQKTAWPAELDGLGRRLETAPRDFGSSPGPGAPPFAWIFEPDVPAMYQAVFRLPDLPGPRTLTPPELLGYCVVEMNGRILEDELVPELVQRHFRGPRGFLYKVALVSAGSPPRLLYRSEADIGLDILKNNDATVELLSSRPQDAFRFMRVRDAGRTAPARPDQQREASRRGRSRAFERRGARRRPALVLASSAGGRWLLALQHRSGSLEAAVRASRRRNLIASFGVLLLLAVSMALILIAAQRARRLAQLQMEFVAGVSHELCTPLSVICAAADNLADGVGASGEQVKTYGALIRSEGRRLAGMLEQVLQYASGRARAAAYHLEPSSVAAIVSRALERVAPLVESTGCQVETDLEPGLPEVSVDADALCQCLANLLSNATKYGGDARWIGIRARLSDATRGPEVQVTVEDRGIGIDKADLDHVFEPFYRAPSVTAAQIHGTGLGLTLARSIAESMGGRLSASSVPGRGSSFTVHLPAPAQGGLLPGASRSWSRA